MKYPGSKRRLAKRISAIVNALRISDDQPYVEPFCGACNVLEHITGHRIANDYNNYVVALWEIASQGWIPPTDVSEQKYREVRDNPDDYSEELVGFIGVGCSYAGKWFGGYARGAGRNWCRESSDAVVKRAKNLIGTEFKSTQYYKLSIPDGSIVYCDPPYAGSTHGYLRSKFNHTQFWKWTIKLSKRCIVIVSEYEAPADFECIYEQQQTSSLDLNTGSKIAVERLFLRGRRLAA